MQYPQTQDHLCDKRLINVVLQHPSKRNPRAPVSLDKTPNSSRNVPQDAVHVTVVSSCGTPYFRLTVPYGRPVAVSNAIKHILAVSQEHSVIQTQLTRQQPLCNINS
jgi:hypothetical protein